ncbi:MAG: PD40 domain-containing protein [Bacteroidales bacterium]|nr:PD40 domain-containing protein [Bacteroidales bacterium]
MKQTLSILLLTSVMFAQAQITNLLQYKKAKRLIYLENYQEALPILDSLSHIDDNNANLNYLLGLCYYHQQQDRQQAIPYLEKASKNVNEKTKEDYKSDEAPMDALYYLAHAYLLDYQLDKCIQTSETLKQKSSDVLYKDKADRLINHAQNAQLLTKMPIQIEINALGANINSTEDDYSPLINADETFMVFTSRREGSTGGQLNDEGRYYEDVYSSIKDMGQWQKAVPFNNNINTTRHDAAVALSADGNDMIIYRDDYGIGNLYSSHLFSNGWSKAEKLSSNVNSKNNETHAAFSHDGQTLYFISDIDGGYGGKDIYFSNKLPNGQWGLPQNLGIGINTKWDEDGVYIHPDGSKLYFSSEGHNSMGGYDIFYCEWLAESGWSEPKNVGYPINTTDDDVFAVFSADGKRAYYSAQKKDGMGGFDIYMMNLMSLPERNNTIVKGPILDANGQIVLGYNLKVYNSEHQLIGQYKANNEGIYTLVLKQGETYFLESNDAKLINNKLEVPGNTAFYITQLPYHIKAIANTLAK